MLWKNFDEYVKRVDSVEEILEYDEKEFNEIQNLYLKALSIEEGTHHIIDNIDNDMSKEDIYNIVNEKIENSLWE
jgi:methyltransferase-like protein